MVKPVAFMVSKPLAVVAALAVRSSNLPLPVIAVVSEIDASAAATIPLPFNWNKVPETSPVFVLAILPVVVTLSKPVVLVMVAVLVGPVIFKPPPV